MFRTLAVLALFLSLIGVAACHTDPFSVKPEVRVVRPAGQPAPRAAETSDKPGPDQEQPQ